MRKHTGGLFYLLGGVLLGAASAYGLSHQVGKTPLGMNTPWFSRSAALEGSTGIYVQSHYLLTGRLPLAAGQMMEAEAEADADGIALSGSCAYEIVSTGALPRWWSLSAVSSGSPSPSLNAAFDSATAVREPDGTVRIRVSAAPQPGNWLNPGSGRTFGLYYAAIHSGNRSTAVVPPFSIGKAKC